MSFKLVAVIMIWDVQVVYYSMECFTKVIKNYLLFYGH